MAGLDKATPLLDGSTSHLIRKDREQPKKRRVRRRAVKIQITLGALALGTAAVFVGQMNSDAIAARGGGENTAPDVILGSLHNSYKYGASGGITGYAIGTTSCNQGNDYLTWDGGNNEHPVIAQNMYRIRTLDNGCTRAEHIGMSWLKHGFCALQQTLCGSCSNPGGGGCSDRLGWNCSDPYEATLNGQQGNLGPRSEVNASIGVFLYPFCQGGSCDNPPATIGRRLQVLTSDMDEDIWPTAEYFVEGMYVHPEDAAACKGYNNASYRPINVSGSGTNGYNISLSSTTRQMKAAIFAWEEYDPNVRVLTFQLSNCAETGRNETYHMAYSTCENDDGTFHYEYALYNLDCDDSFSKFAVPAAGYTNPYSSFAPYHDSGEPYSNEAWANSFDPALGTVVFNCTPFIEDQDANAIRWNTMHTFAFDTTDPPIQGVAYIETFKNGELIEVPTVVPNADYVDPFCSGDVNRDYIVDGTDLALVLGFWGLADADCNDDGTTDGADLSIVLGNWGCTGK